MSGITPVYLGHTVTIIVYKCLCYIFGTQCGAHVLCVLHFWHPIRDQYHCVYVTFLAPNVSLNHSASLCVTHTQGFQIYGGIQIYGWCPNIWGASKCTGGVQNMGHAFFVLGMYGGIQTLSKHRGGCPNIWGH